MFSCTRLPRFCYSFGCATSPVKASPARTGAALLSPRFSRSTRFVSNRSPGLLIVEKLPLFGLSAASSIVAFALQVQSTESVGQLPFGWRLQNALVTYVTYIWQMFWPANLAVFYPHPDDHLALWQVALSALFLI